MRILHVIPSLDPATGGPPIVASRLAGAQAALGHAPHLLAYAFPDSTERTAQLLEPIRDTVGTTLLPPLTRFERVFARGARRRLDALVGGMDVVHLHGVWDPIIKAAGEAARAARVPYALAPHGMLDPWSLQQSRVKKQIALRLGYRHLLDGAAFLHMLNGDEGKLAAPLGLTALVETIPNGVALDEFASLPEPGSFRRQFPRVDDRPFILFLSRLHYKKGLDHLAEAFRVVAMAEGEADLVVAGPDGGAQADFERRIAGHGLQERVHVVGPLYGRDKLAAFVDAAGFCLPSRQEGFSVALVEALACGTPVVASTECHFPEAAEARAGYVVPLDATALADAMLTLLRLDAGGRRAMGEKGQELVRTQYVWPHIAKACVAAYERARSRGARTG